jgi:hypothetical protein
MFAAAVHAVVCILLALWGGLVAALMGWILYGVIVDATACLWPDRFPAAARHLQEVRRRRLRSLQRKLGREYYNSRMPPQFSQACRDTMLDLIERGPDKSAPRKPTANR